MATKLVVYIPAAETTSEFASLISVHNEHFLRVISTYEKSVGNTKYFCQKNNTHAY